MTENKSKIFRRSIFAVKDIKKGEKFSFTNIRRIRPGFGLEPAYFNKLINRKSPYNFNEGEPLKKIFNKKVKSLKLNFYNFVLIVQSFL